MVLVMNFLSRVITVGRLLPPPAIRSGQPDPPSGGVHHATTSRRPVPELASPDLEYEGLKLTPGAGPGGYHRLEI